MDNQTTKIQLTEEQIRLFRWLGNTYFPYHPAESIQHFIVLGIEETETQYIYKIIEPQEYLGEIDPPLLTFRKGDKVNSVLSVVMRFFTTEQLIALRDGLNEWIPKENQKPQP